MASRLFNILLTAAVIMCLNSQVFAQKVTMVPKKKSTIDQQILAQAKALQGPTVKIYSDDTYKRNAKKKKTTKSSVAQTGSAVTFGPSNTYDLRDTDPDTGANISSKMEAEKKAATSQSKLNGSVGITVGHDSNLDVDREGKEGGYFEMKPGLSYAGSIFSGSFGARIKDFSNQENSAIAKETDINADIGAKFSISEDVSTTSKVSFLNSEFRWPDFMDGTDEGMPIRFFETKFTQSLNFKLNSLTVDVNGSYSNRDFTTEYSDFAPEVLGTQGYQRDLNDAKLDAKFDLKFNDNFSFIATPTLKHRKYKKELARQTSGAKGGEALAASTPVREILANEIAVDLKTTLGAFTITPTAKVGQEVDRALGAEDSSYSGGGLTLEIMLDKDTGLKLGGSANFENKKFDNWTEKVVPAGETREVDAINTGLSAGVNLSKSVSLGIDYAREEVESNTIYTDENYTREIIGSTITVSF